MSSSTSPDNAMNESATNDNSPSGGGDAPRTGNEAEVPKPKRLACMICRKRKLKCDGAKPSCSTCTRLGHSCAYDEVRRKSGPKRGYVKALEERLKQVETLLRSQDHGSGGGDVASQIKIGVNGVGGSNVANAASASFNITNPSISIASDRDMDRWRFNPEASPQAPPMDDFNFTSNMQANISMSMSNVEANFTWEMIGLGLDEPLPPQETIDELHQIYFEKVHPSLPMIHKYRYLAAMNLAPNQRPPVCLRYAIWTLASSITDKFQSMKDLFYQRARKYVEADYIKGYGEHMISVAHAQTHVLLASYEFKMMYFPRAWMNAGSAVRLCQMIGLHRLDGAGLDVKQCLPPPRDWTEREERRRTFWMAFCEDRYASIGTGWPMMIDEKDILTNLPASEEAFEMSRPEQTQSLQECMSPAGASKLSSFGGIVLMACLFGRNLTHLHRPDVDDRDNDLNGEFWKRHRTMDNILLNTSLCLPSHLKLPAGLGNPNIVFTNMCIHTSTICLHQAAIFKVDKNKLPSSVSAESKVRCITAANEIASIMRMISHMDLSSMNPFISFCLYVAARVFIQYLKSRPDDSQTADSLRFLLSAMNALKRRNPLTESFLVQLDVDLEALGSKIPQLKSAFPRSGDSAGVNACAVIRAASQTSATDASQPGPRMPQFQHHSDSNSPSAYRNDCHVLKFPGDDGNPVNQPDLVEPEATTRHGSDTANGGASMSQQGWLGAEQSLPARPRSTGASPRGPQMPALTNGYGMFGGGGGGFGTVQSDGGCGDTNGLSPNDQPTPQSSTASDPQQQRHSSRSTGGAGTHLNGGHHPGSGGPSFEASPVASHQVLTNGGSSTTTTTTGTVSQADVDASNAAAAAAFFAADPAFAMHGSTGLTPDPRAYMGGVAGDTPGPDSQYGVPTGQSPWDVGGSGGQGQAAMTPVAEGVLRSLMNMSPMDGMDLGWN